MRYVVIANPGAGSYEDLAPVLDALPPEMRFPMWKTERPGHARELARQAVEEGFDGIVAAGGDGTIHEVVNGIAPDFEKVRLLVLPLGTGNDLCRSLEASLDVEKLQSALLSTVDKNLDVICMRLSNGREIYAVNAVSAGFGGKVTKTLDSDLKARFGPLAFLIGAGEALSELESYRAKIVIDDRETRDAEILGIVFANGRTVAGGLQVAPGASAEDSLIDVVIIESGGPVELAKLAARTATGDILDSEIVELRAASRVRISSEPPMPFSVDGELVDSPPVELEILPKVLRLASPSRERRTGPV